MNSELFAKYAPAINSYLTADKDSAFKGWKELVTIFFAMNTDGRVSANADLAYAFDSAGYPNYLRINASTVSKYFDSFEISRDSLQEEEFEDEKDFICDDLEIRISFNVLRSLVYAKGGKDLTEAYAFIEHVYLIHQRYNIEMIARLKNATHWVLIERVNGFTAQMTPHIGTTKTMKTQPKVYTIVKGSVKSINARLRKYVSDHNKDPTSAKNDIQFASLIYQTMMTNIEDEIYAVSNFLIENRAIPYQQLQVDAGTASSLKDATCSIKIMKNYIMVDPSKYAISQLVEDINVVRSRIQFGTKTHEKAMPMKQYVKQTKKSPNVVDIEIFAQTNGQHIDTKRIIPLSSPSIDDQVSLLMAKVSMTDGRATPPVEVAEAQTTEVEQMEVDEEVPPIVEEKVVPKRAKVAPKTNTRTTATKRARA